MFFELIRRPKGVNIDEEEQVAVTSMNYLIPYPEGEMCTWWEEGYAHRGSQPLSSQRLLSLFAFSAWPVPGSAHTSWCRNLRSSLQVFSHYDHVPAAHYMDPSLPIGHDFREKCLLSTIGHPLWVNALFFSWWESRWINMKALVAQETKG